MAYTPFDPAYAAGRVFGATQDVNRAIGRKLIDWNQATGALVAGGAAGALANAQRGYESFRQGATGVTPAGGAGIEAPYVAPPRQAVLPSASVPPPRPAPVATLGAAAAMAPAIGGRPAPSARTGLSQQAMLAEQTGGLSLPTRYAGITEGRDRMGNRSFSNVPGQQNPTGSLSVIPGPTPEMLQSPYYGITDANTFRLMAQRNREREDRRYQNVLGFESQGPMVDYTPPPSPEAQRFLRAAMNTGSAVTQNNMTDAYFKQLVADRAPLEFAANQQQNRLSLASQAEQNRMQRESGLAQANLQGQYGLQQAALTGQYGIEQAESTRGLAAAADQAKAMRELKRAEYEALIGPSATMAAMTLVPGYAKATPEEQPALLDAYRRQILGYFSGGQQALGGPTMYKPLPTEGTYTAGMGLY